jgi:CRISPR-associated protein Cas2
MRIVVSYDISVVDPGGRKRWRRVMRTCKSYGVRVQYSVFECSVTEKELVDLRHALLSAMDSACDSVRMYYLNDADAGRTEHHGVRVPLDPNRDLIV